MRLPALALLAVSGAPALAQTSLMPVFATPQRVYFVDTASEKGLPPALSIQTMIAIDPALPGGISAREMTVSVDCTANTFTISGLVSLDAALNQVSTDPEPTAPASIGGAFAALRDYVCDGKIPAGVSRYPSRAEALEAGLRIIAANRADPTRQ
jgi:hypothetical protein